MGTAPDASRSPVCSDAPFQIAEPSFRNLDHTLRARRQMYAAQRVAYARRELRKLDVVDGPALCNRERLCRNMGKAQAGRRMCIPNGNAFDSAGLFHDILHFCSQSPSTARGLNISLTLGSMTKTVVLIHAAYATNRQ